MPSKKPSIKEFAAEQSHELLNYFSSNIMEKKSAIPVITICTQPGSGGYLIGSAVARRLGVELYDKSLLVPMAHYAEAESRALETIEKERPTGMQDFISSLLDKDYVYTGDYLQYLKDIIEVIGKLNHGVIIGRGANFILPAKGRFSVRVVAPLDIRVKNVAFRFGVSLAEAKKRVKGREKKRKAFIRESFHQDIENIEHYDLIINTARMNLDAAVTAIIGATIGAQTEGGFEKENSFILRNRK